MVSLITRMTMYGTMVLTSKLIEDVFQTMGVVGEPFECCCIGLGCCHIASECLIINILYFLRPHIIYYLVN